MYCIKSLLCSIPIGIALILELAIAPSTAIKLNRNLSISQVQQAQDKQSDPLPPPTNPDSSAAGGRRDSSACPQDAGIVTKSPALTALSPLSKPGLTLATHPTFLVYVPRTSAKNGEFSLRSQDGRGVYRKTIALTDAPAVISIAPAAQAAPLEVGKQYIWSFAVICNPDDRLEDRFVTGSVQRTKLEPSRLRQIEQTPLKQRIALYQKNGIWYDALALLFELNHTQPNDPSLSIAWREFLQSGRIDTRIDINSDRRLK